MAETDRVEKDTAAEAEKDRGGAESVVVEVTAVAVEVTAVVAEVTAVVAELTAVVEVTAVVDAKGGSPPEFCLCEYRRRDREAEGGSTSHKTGRVRLSPAAAWC